jgi:hypothetical protein
MAREITGRQRRRLFVSGRHLAILNHGTQPLPPRPEASRTESTAARLAP